MYTPTQDSSYHQDYETCLGSGIPIYKPLFATVTGYWVGVSFLVPCQCANINVWIQFCKVHHTFCSLLYCFCETYVDANGFGIWPAQLYFYFYKNILKTPEAVFQVSRL